MRILPRNLQRFALEFQHRFYVPFVNVYWPFLFGGAVSTVKNNVFLTSRTLIFKMRVSLQFRGIFAFRYSFGRTKTTLPRKLHRFALAAKNAKMRKTETRKITKYACVLAFWGCKSKENFDYGLTSHFATVNRWRLAFGHVSASITC